MADPSGRDDQTYGIIGAAMAVHRELGCGFLERVYQETLAIELSLRGIEFKREVRFAIEYKAQLLRLTYIVDFLCYENIVVEVKRWPELAQSNGRRRSTTSACPGTNVDSS